MTTWITRTGCALIACLWLGAASAASLAPISQVISFGDSLSDTGNLFGLTGGALPPEPQYFAGRFSNGPVWVELLSIDLGVTLNNYAYGGAQTGSGNVNGAFPGLVEQIEVFEADLGGGAADSGALYTVWIGANNFCQTCFIPGVDDPEEFIERGVTETVTAIGRLLATGVQKVLVLNLPDLGLTPRGRSSGIGPALGQVTDGWNQALAAGLAGLPIPELRTIDTADFLRQVVADPAGFGLSNIEDACLLVGCNQQMLDPALDPDGFLFWDEIHPTRVTHAILADIAYETVLVPVPPALLLFASALGLFGGMRRINDRRAATDRR